jgi:RimJ/RimL family protein N-acetyltransferase
VHDWLRRNKIGTYAVALVTDYIFSETDIEEIEAPVLAENVASKELLMKLSYAIAGYETFTGKDGVQRAHESYLLLKPENGIVFSLIDFLEMMAQPPAE